MTPPKDFKLNTNDGTQAQLIAAARHLFAKKGYAGTSVKEIADLASVNISLVSYHFGGKEGLYKACLEPLVERKVNFFETNMLTPSSKEDFKLRLQLFLEMMIAEEMEHPEMGCIVHRELQSDDPIIQEIFHKTLLRLFKMMVEYIKSGQKFGYIRKNLDANTITVIFMGGVQNGIRTDRIRKKIFNETLADPKTRKAFIHHTIEMLLVGISNQEKS